MTQQRLYDDGNVALDARGITLRRYYFPFGTSKHIPYSRIRDVLQGRMGTMSGKWRLWGSGDFRHWAPLDLSRPQKEIAFILDTGGWVRPVMTPDDPERVLAILRERIPPHPTEP